MTLAEKFRKSAESIKNLKKKPTEDELLILYSLFKQAEVGDCNIPKPGFLDFVGKAKWEAWNSKKGLSQEAAMEEYIKKADELITKYGIN